MDNGASSYRRFRLEGDECGLAEIIRDYRDGLIFYLNIHNTIMIPPHSGGYFSFGHSPNNTGGAQVRFLLDLPVMHGVTCYP